MAATATATATVTATVAKDRCIKCKKGGSTVECEGCLQLFCYAHLKDHQQQLSKQLEKIEVSRDKFRQTLTQQPAILKQSSLIKQINQWEKDSIKAIQQIATESRNLVVEYMTEHIAQLDNNVTKLSDELNQFRQENNFNEIDLNRCKDKLAELAKELSQPSHILIKQTSTLPIKKISVVKSSSEEVAENVDEDQLTTDEALQNQIELLRQESNEKQATLQEYQLLKTSFDEIKKRCLKHQKQEIEVKRQMTACQSIINDLQSENQKLKERLADETEEYQTLHRKYVELECPVEFSFENEEPNATAVLSDENENNVEELDNRQDEVFENHTEQNEKIEPEPEPEPQPAPADDVPVQQCPVCACQFSADMSVDGKREHIEQHFA